MINLGRIFLVVCLLVTSAPTAGARNRKGDKFQKEGEKAEVRKQYEAALDQYEKALAEDPGDPGYQMAVRRTRFQAAQARVNAGQKMRDLGQLEPALEEFRKAYAIDPASSIADQEYRRTKQMIDAAGKKTSSLSLEEKAMTPADVAQKEALEKLDRIQAAPELRPITRQISTLKMNNQPVKVLYETVGKLAGINVLFDPEYQPPPGKATFTVDLSNTTLEEALDYLGMQTKSFWKPISSNAIFVTSDNVAKRRDYDDYIVKTFYIKNATSIQELQELSTTVRSVTEIRRAFTFNAQNAILVRGTIDQVALAEKLIADLDKPKSEVVVDVIVMEANRGRVRDLAAALTTGGKPGIELPIVYGATGGTTETDAEKPETKLPVVALNRLDSIGLGDFSIAIPGALLQAVMSDSQTRVLQQPQVRAIDNQKASLKIGDKVPYASGSFQPGVGSVGVSPLVSTQFQFYDVGVNVDLTPKVHNREDVSMHVEIEISNVSGRVELGGISQPIISQKKVVHDIRIREGETNLLGGLMQVQETRSISGIPGLASIPVLGRLFGPEHKERNTGELLIALVPHIIRAPDYTETNLRGIAAGNDANVKLNYAPRKDAPVATPPPPASAPATPAPVTPAPATPAAPATAPRLTFNPAMASTPLGSALTVTLQAENVADLFSAPMKLKWDPKVLRLASIREGALLSSDGKQANFSENTLNDVGEAAIVLNRLPGAGGVSGSGALLVLTFQAIGKGSGVVTVTDLQLNNSQMQPMAASAPMLNITVQ